MSPWRVICFSAAFLIAMGLADPDILKRPSRPSQFGSESQVRQYIAELKEYIRQIPSARYGKRFAPPASTSNILYFPGYYKDDNSLKHSLRSIFRSEE